MELNEKMRDKNGITLIALIVTIVVLLILAGVSIAMLTGENGLLNKAQTASEETKKQTASEKMTLKITNVQMETYAKKQMMPTLQELADAFYLDEEIEYVITKNEVASTETVKEKIDVTGHSSIYTKLEEYPYEFEIDSSLRLASINGVKLADGYIKQPTETITITENGEYDVTNYAKANVNVQTNAKYSEEEYQEFGNEKYQEGLNANADLVANSQGYACGKVTLEKAGKIAVNCGFKPKYVMIMCELANGNAANSVVYFYNEKIDNTKSYRYHRASDIMYIYTMEFSGGISKTEYHICDVNNSGFGFYNVVDSQHVIYWTAFK